MLLLFVKYTLIYNITIFIMLAMQARPDRENLKVDIMYKALKCKFSIYPHLN